MKQFLLLCLIAGTVFSEKIAKPFPQNSFPNGIYPPKHKSVEALNKDVQSFYTDWKKEYIHPTATIKNGYILATGGGTNAEEKAITVSEGHGYGMIVAVLMAGYDPSAKDIFDGFYRVFRAYPSVIEPDLMTWQILGTVGKKELPQLDASATDGDFDIAYALILADRQWGSDGEINYLEEAKKVIAANGRKNIHPTLKRTLLGDWVSPGQKWEVGTRSSDWMPAHFSLFAEVSGSPLWNEVKDTTYSILFAVQNPQTGLVPDFIDKVKPVPAGPNFLETERDGHFSSNACRTPWRIAMDFYHYDEPRSKKALMPLLSWIDSLTDSDLSQMDNGYALDGKADWSVDDWGTWGAYSAPMMTAATVDSSFAGLVSTGWEHNKKHYDEAGYYSNTLRLLSLLAVSGNWWNPSVE